MKRAISFIVVLLMILTLTGCGRYQTDVRVITGWFRWENLHIDMNEYDLIQNHPYDIIETERGADLVLHFEWPEVSQNDNI